MSIVDLDSVRHHVEILRMIKQREKEMEDLKKAAQDAIQQAMGGHDTGVLDGEVVVTWSHYKSKSFQGKAFAAAHPELAAEFTEQIGKRRFEFKA